MKGINTPGGFASFVAPRGEVWILTLPALARESGPFHGPFPLAPFGMKGNFRHLTLPALARESGPFHGPFPLAPFGNHTMGE